MLRMNQSLKDVLIEILRNKSSMEIHWLNDEEYKFSFLGRKFKIKTLWYQTKAKESFYSQFNLAASEILQSEFNSLINESLPITNLDSNFKLYNVNSLPLKDLNYENLKKEILKNESKILILNEDVFFKTRFEDDFMNNEIPIKNFIVNLEHDSVASHHYWSEGDPLLENFLNVNQYIISIGHNKITVKNKDSQVSFNYACPRSLFKCLLNPTNLKNFILSKITLADPIEMDEL